MGISVVGVVVRKFSDRKAGLVIRATIKPYSLTGLLVPLLRFTQQSPRIIICCQLVIYTGSVSPPASIDRAVMLALALHLLFMSQK